MTPELVSTIVQAYGLAPRQVAPRESGYRNHAFKVELQGGSHVLLLLYKDEPGILRRVKNANEISDYLAQGGLPTRQSVDTRIMQLSRATKRRYTCLYYYLPGHTIPWEAYTKRHLHELGRTMSRMHALLAAAPPALSCRLPRAGQELQAICLRVAAYFAQSDVNLAASRKLGWMPAAVDFSRYEVAIIAASRLPLAQPLHMDFVRGNILFDTSPDRPQITGIIDFEKTAVGHPVFDVGRTVAFLLVDSKYKTDGQTYRYFLQSGYNKRGSAAFRLPMASSNGRKLNILQELISFYLLYDLYKFLRHNPYESLGQNEHYTRTRDQLLRRGVLAKANRFAPLVP